MRIISSSPGKVILFGEHFVVKGCPAIATAINLRTKVILKPRNSWPSIIRSTALNASLKVTEDFRANGSNLLIHFIKALELLEEKGLFLKPFEAVISGDLPSAAGLGSSASSAASFISALSMYLGDELSRDELFLLTNELERLVHKNPSGIDSAIVVYGGTILYQKDKEFRRLVIEENKELPLLIACTRSKRNTGEVVQSVLDLAERRWDILRHVYKAAGTLVEKAMKLLEKGDVLSLGELMNLNQGLLYVIGVSSFELERVIFELRKSGCIGSKLTGAGRGGCVIALCADPDAVQNRLSNLAEKMFVANINAPGTEVKLMK